MQNQSIVYNPNPTAAKFHASDSPYRLLFGPIGSGKSVACCLEIFMRAARQPAAQDGIRYSRWLIIRNTYPQLKSTTIQTWLQWFPENLFGKIKWDSPISHHIKTGDIDLEVYFMSVDGVGDLGKLLSLEITGVWINELRELPYRVFIDSFSRCSRYPSGAKGKCGWYGLIADTNPPDTKHWIYKYFEKQKIDEYEVFYQPPGLIKKDGAYVQNQNADNIKNLMPTYYTAQIAGKDEEWIKVYLLGEYGFVQEGKGVYETVYNDTLHFSRKYLDYDAELQLGFGWDFGLTPALAIVQQKPNGQIQVLDELWTDEMGLRQFVQNVVLPHLNLHYSSWENNFVSICDPSGLNRSQTDEQTCLDILEQEGITTEPAFTNVAETRKDAMRYLLTKLIDGEMAFSLSQKVNHIREGFLGGYHYKRVRSSEGETYKPQPDKNMYSHVMEALEYIVMFYVEHHVNKQQKKYEPRIYTGSFMGM